MTSLEVAGVVGTWVAASLAIIALVGIVGPVLIWRACRTERHKAIVNIGLRNNGCTSKGIPVWPGVRLGQRVRAPRINQPRKFKEGERKSFDSQRMATYGAQNQDSPALWVSFGAFLSGYTVQFEKDCDVAISDGFTFLPVSKAFLVTFALVGRFSGEIDRKHQTNETGDVVKNSWSVTFVGNSTLERLEVPQDSIDLETIGMLCLGFLPFCEDSYINVLDPLAEDDKGSETSDDDDSEVHQVAKGYTRRKSNNRVEDDVYERRRDTNTPVRFKAVIDPNERPMIIIAYELLEITLTEAEILDCLPRNGRSKYFALYEMTLDRKTQSELQDLSEHTYVPAGSPWVRLKAFPQRYNEPLSECFVKREHAQQITLSLLSVPWHPEGYLIPGAAQPDSRAKIMELLCTISERTRPFLIRLKEGAKVLGMTATEENTFVKTAEPVIRRAASAPTRRSLLEVLFALDEFAKQIQHERFEVQQIVGILMLTNKEFTELVYQSARHMSASSNVSVELDLQTGSMTIPSTFGTIQTFVLDMDALYKDQVQLGARGKISIKHADVLKAALRAYLRSSMLASCYDADPLIECLESITSDVVHMG